MVDQPPFQWSEATYQSWVGDKPETDSGLVLEIPIQSNSTNLKLHKAFFRGKITDIDMKTTDSGIMAQANFMNQMIKKPNIVMHADSRQEIGNQPPTLQEAFPFDLEDDECVLSYQEDGKTKYFKIDGVKEKKSLLYQ